MAKRQRSSALARYYATNPVCCQCNKPLVVPDNVKVNEVRMKRFCNQSCAATWRNNHRPRKFHCTDCGKPLRASNTLRCRPCDVIRRSIGTRRKHEVTRRTIAAHSKTVMQGRPRLCKKCGWTKFAQICHKKPVRAFSADATLNEINAPNNLEYLCPNCHWELDHT